MTRTDFLLTLGICLMVLSYLLKEPYMGFVSWIFLYTAFDVYGFALAGSVKYYRIIQVMFQLFLTGFLVERLGWTVGLASLLAWYLLACDVLFYFCKGLPLDDFSWWTASPVVFIWKIVFRQKAAPRFAVACSAILGVLGGIYLLCR